MNNVARPIHFDKNFAVWFPFWDIVFGTVHKPSPGEYPKTGVPGISVNSVAEAYALPFKGWLAMARARLTAKQPV